MSRKLDAEHGTVFSLGRDRLGYFGWPTVAKMDDGTLVIAGSGMRMEHVCSFGRTVFLKSEDEGRTWSSPRVINDSPFDDRDAGVLCTGGDNLLVTWFTSDTRYYAENHRERGNVVWPRLMAPGLRWQNDEAAERFVGAWVMLSDDRGDTWGKPIRVPVTAPHGPIRLRSGRLLYLGKEFGSGMRGFTKGDRDVKALASDDGGQTWQELGTAPVYPGLTNDCYHEPHVAELPSGKLVGLIRVEARGEGFENAGVPAFSHAQTTSTDGGRTWSDPVAWGFRGAPPHLLAHSSGALVCVYGHRDDPFGERVSISRDEGESWEHHLVLRDDGPDWDLGYPSSVELSDGSIFTLYYQKEKSSDEKCTLLWSRWRLP